MTRYSDNEIVAELNWAPKVNVAANFWRKQCFLSDRSLVWQAHLCKLNNLSQLHHRIERLK